MHHEMTASDPGSVEDMTEACTTIMDAGGIAYRTRRAFLVALPIDGEWVATRAETLKDASDLARSSDGQAIDDGIEMARPHLTIDDAIEELEGWGDGHMTRIVVARNDTVA